MFASSVVFFVIVAIAIIVGRLPSFGFDAALNPDEAQVITQAVNLPKHPVPWSTYDPNTAGPLDSALAALPRVFGREPTYFSSRLIAAALLLITLIALYLTLRGTYGELAARLATGPAIGFFALAAQPAYLQYSTELLAICLAAVATAIGLSALRSTGRRRTQLLLVCGLIVGASPFGKLQAAPLALYTAASLLFAIASTVRGRALGVAFAALLCGLVLVPIEILAPVATSGALGDFTISYIAFPFLYYSRENCCHPIGPSYFFGDPFIGTFVVSSAVIACIAIFVIGLRKRHEDGGELGSDQSWLPVYFFGLSIAAIYAINRPQTLLQHYVFFLIFPVCGLVGSLLGLSMIWIRRADLESLRGAYIGIAAIVATTALIPPLANRAWLDGENFLGTPVDPAQVQVVAMLRRHVERGNTMAIWGWMPQYFIDTGTTPGTRDTITQFQIEPRHYLRYYRDRYVADMLQNRPQFFLDVVAPSSFAYKNRAAQGFETFPALDSLVEKSYHLVDTAEGVRLYQRNS